MLWNIIYDTLLDGIKLLPFLAVTYLAMEYIEHKSGNRAQQIIRKSGRFGPVIGGMLGIVPQCGFSTAAANFYTARIITCGTLLSVFLSTSDEMLPIFISEKVSPGIIGRILGLKVLISVAAGFGVDFVLRRRSAAQQEGLRIEHMCGQEHCHCGEGRIWRSALHHTFQIFFFLLLVSFLLNIAIGLAGEEALVNLLTGRPVLGPALAALVGLIPNCASSVAITQLYLEGVLNAGSMMAGLLVSSGVGLLVLFRVNEDKKENLRISAMLYGIGVISGILIEASGLTF